MKKLAITQLTLLVLGIFLASASQATTRTYYSVATGNASGTNWSLTPTGPPIALPGNGLYQHVVIQSGFIITQDMDLKLNDFTIENNGAFIVQGSSTMEIVGDWTNDGTFESATGKVTFNTSGSQTIGGISTTTFYDLEANPKIDLDMASPCEVKNTMDILDGNVISFGNLTFLSDAGGTAMLVESLGTITGAVNVQRYHDAQAQDWVMLCCPLINKTISEWNDDILTTGFPGADYPNYNWNTILSYDETVIGTDDDGFVGASDISDPIPPGKGFFVYTQEGSFTLDMTGKIKTGLVSFPVSYTSSGTAAHDGWNLVANPYQCTIDWDAGSGWTKARINDAIHVYDAALGVYATYINGVGNNGGSPLIAPGQAFWVQANAPGPFFECDEEVKSRSQSTFKSGDSQSIFRFDLDASGYADQLTLVVNQEATPEFDEHFDGSKLVASDSRPSISSESSDEKMLSINALPLASEAMDIPIYIEGPEAGSFVISWGERDNFMAGSCVQLIDLLTEEEYSIDEPGEITFDFDPANEGPRFTLSVSQSAIAETHDVSCNGLTDGSIVISPDDVSDVTVTNSEGVILFTGNQIDEDITIDGLSSGIYHVTLSDQGACQNLIADVMISQPFPVIADFQTISDLYALIEGQAHVAFENLSQGATQFEWDFDDNSLSSDAENPEHTYSMAGSYSITLTASDEDCSSSQTKDITILEESMTGLYELFKAGRFSAWMTPGEIQVELKFDETRHVRVAAYNLLGQLLSEPIEGTVQNEILIIPTDVNHAIVEVYDIENEERFTIQVVY